MPALDECFQWVNRYTARISALVDRALRPYFGLSARQV
jgi:hypothetical protein